MKKFTFYTVFGLFILLPVLTWVLSLPSGMTWEFSLYGAGQLAALIGFIFIFFQYILSARIQWIERGIGLDRLFRSHRILGLSGLVLVLVHPVTLTIFEFLQGRGFIMYSLKAIGVFAFIIVLIAAAVAILHVRLRIRYETWKNIHKIGYVIFPLALVHSLFLGSTVRQTHLTVFWIALAVLYASALIWKASVWIRIRRNPFTVTDVVQETRDTWSLSFEKKKVSYLPGQFMIVRLERDRKISEPHPFTISSSPTQDRLSITVKAVGDFTSTIGRTKTTDRAFIEAPFGVFSFLSLRDAGDLVFIAGGIGITPFISMLRYMRDKKINRKVLLLWGNKTEGDIAFKDELEGLLKGTPSLRVVHVLSAQNDWHGEKGFIDSEKLKRHVQDFNKSHFLLCGPPVMMKKVERALLGLGTPKRRILYERFAL